MSSENSQEVGPRHATFPFPLPPSAVVPVTAVDRVLSLPHASSMIATVRSFVRASFFRVSPLELELEPEL